MENKVYIITAAGGNATAIKVLAEAKNRSDYETIGRQLIADNQSLMVEQAGFLIIADNHFEMSGGEFCGNAARAVAILFSQLRRNSEVEFTMSGFPNTVKANVTPLNASKFQVECIFPDMPIEVREVNVAPKAKLVDLGGIVHVVIEDDFPFHDFEAKHREITKLLDLENREAVGVAWIKKYESQAKINPVVWVKGIDSFFHESSCGSGSIAVAKVTNFSRILQPSGEFIEVFTKGNQTILSSEMEVIDGND